VLISFHPGNIIDDISSLSLVAEWTVEAVSDKIHETYNDEIAKKFEGKHNLFSTFSWPFTTQFSSRYLLN